ncbi:TatD family hydrolase [Candidatus Babeliales bacterium]|nr:TatD family hydrolase [Candidatus Babeliales bacterium]MBP9843555.1 TatD family hydrolase [Candidatus Babeliales bacterium]
MLIDTHCHINIMLRGYKTKSSYTEFTPSEIEHADKIIEQAYKQDTQLIINVGTDLIESLTCVNLAKIYTNCYAIVGIHPNDATENWKDDFKKISSYVQEHELHKIIGIGECGIDLHYENYNLSRQQDAFKAQIELALEHDLALSIHSRDAAEETFKIIDQYRNESNFRGIMHCFAYDQGYADEAIKSNLVLGIGGTLTYPKNEILRSVVKTIGLENIVLETDAPFLPPQTMRGKENSPANIKIVAEFIAQLKETTYETVANVTTNNVKKLCKLA